MDSADIIFFILLLLLAGLVAGALVGIGRKKPDLSAFEGVGTRQPENPGNDTKTAHSDSKTQELARQLEEAQAALKMEQARRRQIQDSALNTEKYSIDLEIELVTLCQAEPALKEALSPKVREMVEKHEEKHKSLSQMSESLRGLISDQVEDRVKWRD